MSEFLDADSGLFTREELEVIRAIDAGNLYRACLANLTMTPQPTHAQNVEIGRTINQARKLAVAPENQELKPAILNATNLLAGELTLGNTRLAISRVKRLANQVPLNDDDFADCVQTGLEAMLKAAGEYNPWHKMEHIGDNPEDAGHFSTIAVNRVDWDLVRTAPERLSPIMVKNEALHETFRYRKEQQLRLQTGEAVDHLEITRDLAKKKGLKANRKTLPGIAERWQMAQNAAEVVSLDAPQEIYVNFGDNDEPQPFEVELGELLPDPKNQNPEMIVEQRLLIKETRNVISEVLNNCVTPRERLVLEARFGLTDGNARSAEETASRLRIHPSRIRQIQYNALEHIRRSTKHGPHLFRLLERMNSLF